MVQKKVLKKRNMCRKKIEGRWGHDDEQVTPSSRGLERCAANHLPITRSKTGKVSGDVYARTQFRDRERANGADNGNRVSKHFDPPQKEKAKART